MSHTGEVYEVDTYPVKEGLDGLTVELHHGLAGLSSAVRQSFTTLTEPGYSPENPNIVDALFAIAESINELADSVKALNTRK